MFQSQINITAYNKIMSLIPNLTLSAFNSESNGLIILNISQMNKSISEKLNQLHRTDYYQLLMLQQGNCKAALDLKIYDVLPLNIISINKNRFSQFIFSDDAEGYLVLFSDEYIYKYPQDLGWLKNFSMFNHTVNPVSELSATDFDGIKQFVDKLQREFSSDKFFGSEDLITNILKILLLSIERVKRNSEIDSKPKGTELDIIEKFNELLELNYQTERAVQFYADNLSLTCKKLNQIVYEQWGKTAKSIIIDRVALEIKRLLKHTNLSAKEISTYLNFNDPTNFNKFCKRYLDTTPHTFRLISKKY